MSHGLAEILIVREIASEDPLHLLPLLCRFYILTTKLDSQFFCLFTIFVVEVVLAQLEDLVRYAILQEWHVLEHLVYLRDALIGFSEEFVVLLEYLFALDSGVWVLA